MIQFVMKQLLERKFIAYHILTSLILLIISLTLILNGYKAIGVVFVVLTLLSVFTYEVALLTELIVWIFKSISKMVNIKCLIKH